VRTRRSNHEGTYHARDGKIRCQIQVDGMRVSGTGRTRREAMAAARERAKVATSVPTDTTLADAVDRFEQIDLDRLGIRATTRDQYVTLARSKLGDLGDVKLKRLTAKQIAAAFADMTGAASTRRSTYAAIVRVLDLAVIEGDVGHNVARDVARPTATASRTSRHVEAEQIAKLLTAAQGHPLEAAAWLGVGCGLRRGEILGLRWSDVDLDSGVLHVRGNVTRSSAGLQRGEPKTRAGVRQVPMPPQVIAVLKEQRRRQARARLRLGEAWGSSDAVIAGDVGELVEPRTLSRAWSKWATAAGIPDRGTHIGRHYAASTLLGSGEASVADVAAQLGHDPSVLLSTYAVAAATGQRRAANALGATLPGAVLGAVPVREADAG
jgi:integrase